MFYTALKSPIAYETIR